MWAYQAYVTKTERAVLTETEEIKQEITSPPAETGTRIVPNSQQIVAWNASDNHADSVTNIVGHHPLVLIGKGVVVSPTDRDQPEQIRKMSSDQEGFVVFLMTEIDAEFLKSTIRTEVNPNLTVGDLTNSRIYMLCGIDLEGEESLYGKEVYVPGDGCGSAFHTEAKKPSGESLYLGSFFH